MQGVRCKIHLILLVFMITLVPLWMWPNAQSWNKIPVLSLLIAAHRNTSWSIFPKKQFGSLWEENKLWSSLLHSYLTSSHARHFPTAVHHILGDKKSSASQGQWYCFVSYTGSLFLQPDFLDVLPSLKESKNSICERLTSPGILGETKQRLVWVDFMSHFYD